MARAIPSVCFERGREFRPWEVGKNGGAGGSFMRSTYRTIISITHPSFKGEGGGGKRRTFTVIYQQADDAKEKERNIATAAILVRNVVMTSKSRSLSSRGVDVGDMSRTFPALRMQYTERERRAFKQKQNEHVHAERAVSRCPKYVIPNAYF